MGSVHSGHSTMRIRLDLGIYTLFLCLLPLVGCVHSPPDDPWDPLEGVNRGVFKFNAVADRAVIRPVARGYKAVTPTPVRDGIGNFFDNLSQPVVMANSLAQLNWDSFNQSLGRFMINSTVGIGGLFDMATRFDVAHPDEDLGQTLGHWGLGAGPYLVLPLLGPSDGRDVVGFVGDRAWAPGLSDIDAIDDDYDYIPPAATALDLIDQRTRLLPLDPVIDAQLDPYVFVRNQYLKRRTQRVENLDTASVSAGTAADPQDTAKP